MGLGPHSGSELGADFNPWTPAAYAESMAGADDEFEAEAEAEAEVEEDAATRFAAGFRPKGGSARGSSSTSWGGQCGGVPTAIGAPSHTHGLSFTRKPQPKNISSPRTFLTEAVEAASGLGRWVAGSAGGRRRCVASFWPGVGPHHTGDEPNQSQ